MGTGWPQAEVHARRCGDRCVGVGMGMRAVMVVRMGVLGPIDVPVHMLMGRLMAVAGVGRIGMGVPHDGAVREDMLVQVRVRMVMLALVDVRVRVHRAVRVAMFVLMGRLIF